MITVLDCETTGLPKNYNAHPSDFENWPRVVQLAWSTFDDDGLICQHNHIIYPADFEIPESVVAVHGITTERARLEGVYLRPVLETMLSDIAKSDFVVAHNVSFDVSVIGSEFLRAGLVNPFEVVKQICTMKSSTDYCKIDGLRGYKWPKLAELYKILFPADEMLKEHDASNDVATCARCFFELVDRHVISLNDELVSPSEFIAPVRQETKPLAQLVDELKYKRIDLAEVVAEAKEIKQEIVDRLEKVSARQREIDAACAELEKKIREQGASHYVLTQEKHPTAGVEIKLFDEATIEKPDAVRDWCFKGLPAALVMDEKKVKKYALDFGDIPGVKVVRDVPRVQIATKL
jgi:DNA polymerase-3 subunit epsilon